MAWKARRAGERGIAWEGNHEFSEGERLILVMLCDIHKALNLKAQSIRTS